MTSLVLMPDGITFKKLNKAEEEALKKYYKRSRDLEGKAIARGLPIILATSIAAAAYVFRDNILERIKEEGIGIVEQGGLGLAKILTFIARASTSTVKGGPTEQPREPEIGPRGEALTVCQRYEADYVADNELHTVPFVGKVLQALAQLNTIQKMKKEGCSRPSIIPQGQWDQG